MRHEWKPSGWDEHGRRPRCQEMECIHCGLTLDIDSGETASAAYCEVEA